VLTPEQKIAEYPLLVQRIAALEAKLAWFQKQVFGGGRSEKLDLSQQQLALGGVEEARAAVAEKTEQIAYERSREPRRTPAETFAHVPVTETVELVPEVVQRDPELYERIGEERTFEIDLVPARLVKRELVRPKYRHRLDRSRAPLLAAAPARVVPGGYASAGLIASIVIGEYVAHLPFYSGSGIMLSGVSDVAIAGLVSCRTMCEAMSDTPQLN